MWMILQAEKAEDWVIATGVTTTVRDFVQMAFEEVGIYLRFEGYGVNEKGIIDSIDKVKFETSTSQQLNTSTLTEGQTILEVDPSYFRPTEVDLLLGDPTKAKEQLGWEPEYDLKALVDDMIKSDISLFKKDVDLMKAGHEILRQAE